VDEIGRLAAFEQEAARARVECPEDVLVELECRQDRTRVCLSAESVVM
jgi:hypothetical protein